MQTITKVPKSQVKLTDSFWEKRVEVVEKELIPYQWKALNDKLPNTEPSHAIENFKIAAGDADGEFYGMVFQDSDVAKWLEAVAYSLENNPNEDLENLADELINLLEKAQQADGYLNTYYTVKEPAKRWSNVRGNHELYCAGHLIEAAVAYYEATGKRKFLEIMCNYADYIATVFGDGPDQIAGYPGHQEIELALIKLYKVTGQKTYLNLSKYFIDQRGKTPHFYDVEAEKRGDSNPFWWNNDPAYSQAHLPVREQTKAVGHSVRAIYMYTAMADLAAETNDPSLKKACKALWKNVTRKQMYITAGVGSTEYGEAFTFDYDLPNDTSYTETCASIALVYWADRMLKLEKKAEYADILERALYNGTISGMDLDGKRFFYVNPLEVTPEVANGRADHKHIKTERQPWFGCACCPPNIARLITSVGRYIYTAEESTIFIHQFTGNESVFNVEGTSVKLNQVTNYPWYGNVDITVKPEQATTFTIAVRLPGWCDGATVSVNGKSTIAESVNKDGYVYLTREWNEDDLIHLHFPMPIERIHANPKVRENAGKIALQRGPIVYCLEEIDNNSDLQSIYLPTGSKLKAYYDSDFLDGVVYLSGEAERKLTESSDTLYSKNPYPSKPIHFKAIPYYAWCNRTPGEMRVWIKEIGN